MSAESKSSKELSARDRLEPGEKPTLKTLSRLSGMAVPTVSRALKDAPDISDSTKAKVRRIAQEVGYVPNRAGVRLRTGKTNVIALVLGMDRHMMNHTSDLIRSVSMELTGTPYHLIAMPRQHGEDPLERIRYLVETGSADGVIMNQTTKDDPRAAYMMERNFPFATHGRTSDATPHAFYDFDNRVFGRLAVRKLASNGRKKILAILPPVHHFYSQDTRRGLEEAAKDMGVELFFNETVDSDSDIGRIDDYFLSYLSSVPEIDAIVGSSPASVMAAVSAAEGLGRVVGTDIDVLGRESIRFLKQFRKEVIVMHEDVTKAGRFLTRAVLKAIADPAAPPMQGMDVPEPIFN
ncbi:MAG: LacI family DNA-binding transcriptional regulator [Marivivens sp.]|nr:LacI family DNA-binding transcriptional regulator [Marivivens sp.]